MRRRSTKLDGFFAFGPGDKGADDLEPVCDRAGAERHVSGLLMSLKALPAIVIEASKPSGPDTTGLQGAVDIDPHLASLTLAAGGAEFFRGEGERPTNLPQLIDRVGSVAFRNVALLVTFHGLFKDPLPWYGFGELGLWWHLAGTAVAAWKIGEALSFHKIAREVLFFAGVLHDIGKPTMQGLVGEMGPPADAASKEGQLTVLEAELRTVSMAHPELVPLLLDIWRVEHSVFPIAEHHHAPQRAGEQTIQATIVQLADILANQAELGLDRSYGFSCPSPEKVAEKLNLPAPAWKSIADELGWVVADLVTEIESVGE